MGNFDGDEAHKVYGESTTNREKCTDSLTQSEAGHRSTAVLLKSMEGWLWNLEVSKPGCWW